VRWPIRRVALAIEQGREETGKLKAVALFRVLSEDWSPWIALSKMRERWPERGFGMRCGYLGSQICARGCWNPARVRGGKYRDPLRSRYNKIVRGSKGSN